jgi:flagellar basal-body rod protein FlgG
MPDGYSIAALSMLNDMQRMNSISQNLTNVLTPAYKSESSVSTSFSNLIMGNGSFTAPIPEISNVPDLKQGTSRFTGNPLDMAIETAGFFEVQHAGQTYYTRQGNFTLNANGELTTQSGDIVSGVSGDIKLNTPNPTIDRQGNILENGKPIGQIKLVQFTDPSQLKYVGEGKFVQANATIKANERFSVRQSYIEASNVNSANEMVKMIETMRHFETGQKIIQMYDEMNDKAISKLGEF